MMVLNINIILFTWEMEEPDLPHIGLSHAPLMPISSQIMLSELWRAVISNKALWIWALISRSFLDTFCSFMRYLAKRLPAFNLALMSTGP